MNENKTTRDMTLIEFEDWATQYCLDGLIMGGFAEVKRRMSMIIGQQLLIHRNEGGFKKETNQ